MRNPNNLLEDLQMRKEVKDAIRELCERTKDIRNGKYKINGGNKYDKGNECKYVRKLYK